MLIGPTLLCSVCLALATLSGVEPPTKPATPSPQVETLGSARAVLLYSTRGDNKLHVLGASDLSLIASHDLAVGAHEFAVSPDNRWAIGMAYGGPGQGHKPADSRVAVFDLKSGKVHRTVDLKPLSRPNDAAFTADAKHAYITIEAPPRVVKLNVETGEHTAITLERGANHMLTLSPDGKRLYVAHVMPGGVTVIDTTSDTVIKTVTVPDGAEGLAVTPDNAKVWVSCNRSHKIVVIDAAKNEVERTIDCQGFPFRLRMAPDGKAVAVSLPMSDEVAVFETADPEKVRRIRVSPTPADVSPAPTSSEDGRSGATAGKTPGKTPTSIAFTPDGKRLGVVCAEGLVLVDLAEGKVVARRPTDGPIPDALAAATVELKPSGKAD